VSYASADAKIEPLKSFHVSSMPSFSKSTGECSARSILLEWTSLSKEFADTWSETFGGDVRMGMRKDMWASIDGGTNCRIALEQVGAFGIVRRRVVCVKCRGFHGCVLEFRGLGRFEELSVRRSRRTRLSSKASSDRCLSICRSHSPRRR